MSSQRKLSIAYLVLILTFILVPRARAEDLPDLKIRPRRHLIAPVNQPISTRFEPHGLAKGEQLHVSGNLPEGLSYRIEGSRALVLEGTVKYPQFCQIHFQANGRKTETRILFFHNERNQPLYAIDFRKIKETPTHIQFEVTATNVNGMPITSAVLESIRSLAPGSAPEYDRSGLPAVSEGEQATTTIWWKKRPVVALYLQLEAKGDAGSVEPVQRRKIAVGLYHDCEYNESIGPIDPMSGLVTGH